MTTFVSRIINMYKVQY